MRRRLINAQSPKGRTVIRAEFSLGTCSIDARRSRIIHPRSFSVGSSSRMVPVECSLRRTNNWRANAIDPARCMRRSRVYLYMCSGTAYSGGPLCVAEERERRARDRSREIVINNLEARSGYPLAPTRLYRGARTESE